MAKDLTPKDYEILGKLNNEMTLLESVVSILRNNLNAANGAEGEDTFNSLLSTMYITTKTLATTSDELIAILTDAMTNAFEGLPTVSTAENSQISPEDFAE